MKVPTWIHEYKIKDSLKSTLSIYQQNRQPLMSPSLSVSTDTHEQPENDKSIGVRTPTNLKTT